MGLLRIERLERLLDIRGLVRSFDVLGRSLLLLDNGRLAVFMTVVVTAAVMAVVMWQ